MLRKIVIVGAALALMPSPPDEAQTPEQMAAGKTSVFSYVAAASETVADLRGFCERNAFACDVGGKLAVTLEGKAKYSAKLLYEWANEATRPEDQASQPVLAHVRPKSQDKLEAAPPLRLVSTADEMALEELIIEKSKSDPEEG